jgi:hypothetical protein
MLLSDLGLVDASKITSVPAYAGHTNFVDMSSPLVRGLRGLARQTYEAVPIGYEPGRAPIWTIETSAFRAAGGTMVGGVDKQSGAGGFIPSTSAPKAADLIANLGGLALGKGQVLVLGALLPDPTKEYYHPYGLDAYATTYTGNLLLRNMLGWDETYTTPPLVVENLGKSQPGAHSLASPSSVAGGKSSTAAPGAMLALLAVAAVVAALRRR